MAADQHLGYSYARAGERVTMEVPQPDIRVNRISAISNDEAVRFMTYQGALDAAVFLTLPRKLVARRLPYGRPCAPGTASKIGWSFYNA